jgi:hypothetical protein
MEKYMLHNHKSQALSMDFLIACSVFILAFSILYIYWAYTTKRIDETRKINDMIDKTYLISQIWFRDGIPVYWDSSNVIDIGLSNNHRFNQTKMNDLSVIGYNKTKERIGVETYDYYFRVFNETGNEVYSFGLYPSISENTIKIKRVGILNGSLALLEVMVWE